MDCLFTICGTSTILYLYYCQFTKLPKTISIYDLFPSQDKIDRHKVILYSRINYRNNDTYLKNKNQLYTFNIKEHSQRDKKIGIYIRLRISNRIKNKLKNWINHIRYKPGSMIFEQLNYKWSNSDNSPFTKVSNLDKNYIFNYQYMNKHVHHNPIKGKYKPDFDFKKIKINDVGRYSITRPYEAKQIIIYIQEQIKELMKKEAKDCIITDGTSGVGGDTIHFSKYFKSVNAVDILKENTELLKDNCKTFGITNVNVICDNYLNVCNTIDQSILYLDPPWGGVKYKEKEKIKLMLGDLCLSEAISKINSNPLIFLKLPLNSDLSQLNVFKKYTILNKKNSPSFYLVQLKYEPRTEKQNPVDKKVYPPVQLHNICESTKLLYHL
jgi:16S rRNA G966 N2-methylase RsmD